MWDVGAQQACARSEDGSARNKAEVGAGAGTKVWAKVRLGARQGRGGAHKGFLKSNSGSGSKNKAKL